ncbi:MAG TPA: hypothetical protein VEQ59_06445 [Polyangiaceae bacterium]|nr:hypothetical protein [Polyangiaceae bacterium]
MGRETEPILRSLTNSELSSLARSLELNWPQDAIIKGESWPGVDDDRRNYRLTMWTARSPLEPVCSTWLVERHGNLYRLKTRPAEPHEIELLLDTLRELGALEPDAVESIAEATYDCGQHTFQLCFTALEDMREGTPYKRWIFRRHPDPRPLSVAYLQETRRDNSYDTLPGGAILRGNPWSD